MLNIAICDDQEIILEHVHHTIHKGMKSFREDFKIQCFVSGDKLIEEAYRAKYDIVFLDININKDQEGFEVAKKLRDLLGEDLIIIFLTAYDKYVYNCFEYKPLGFIRKVLLEEELKPMITKALKQIEETKVQSCIFKTATGEIKLGVEDIFYIEKIGRKTFIFSKKGEFETSYSLSEVQTMIDSSKLIMIYRSIIVNLDYILKIDKSTVVLEDGKQLPLSRHRIKDVKVAFTLRL